MLTYNTYSHIFFLVPCIILIIFAVLISNSENIQNSVFVTGTEVHDDTPINEKPDFLFLRFHKVGSTSSVKMFEDIYNQKFESRKVKKQEIKFEEVKTPKEDREPILCLDHDCLRPIQEFTSTHDFEKHPIDSATMSFANLIGYESITSPGSSKICAIFRDPITKFNSAFYYYKNINYHHVLEGTYYNDRAPDPTFITKELKSESLLSKHTSLAQELSVNLASTLYEDINAYIRRLYQINKDSNGNLKKMILNEYYSALGGHSSVENAKSMVDLIDVIGLTEDFEGMRLRMAKVTGVANPEDLEIKHGKSDHSYFFGVEMIKEEELAMLTELLSYDIEIYNYVVDKCHGYGEQKDDDKTTTKKNKKSKRRLFGLKTN